MLMYHINTLHLLGAADGDGAVGKARELTTSEKIRKFIKMIFIFQEEKLLAKCLLTTS